MKSLRLENPPSQKDDGALNAGLGLGNVRKSPEQSVDDDGFASFFFFFFGAHCCKESICFEMRPARSGKEGELKFGIFAFKGSRRFVMEFGFFVLKR